MGRKLTVLRDEMGIRGGGLYAIMPFEKLDKHGKGLFKVGLAIDLGKRMDSYHTTFINGFYYVSILQEPRANRTVEHKNKTKERLTLNSYYLKIERDIFKHLVELGAKRMTSTTRVKRVNDKGEGETEWFYTTPDIIHEAFEMANNEYGGTLENNHLKDINKTAATRNKHEKKYIGEIVYFV